MTTWLPVVYVVDDEQVVRRALVRLLTAAGRLAHAFESAQAFLDGHDPDVPGCAVLDYAMPGQNGLELQKALAARGSVLPIIFLTGHGDVPISVQAMKDGAVDFLTKPVDDAELLTAIDRALEHNREWRQARAEQDEFARRFRLLTPREREVMGHLLLGKLNKQVAADLGTVEKTIKVHRTRVMEKMQVRSLAELARLAERAQIGLGYHRIERGLDLGPISQIAATR
jgi:FixJ family two-component response regulator